MHVLVDTLEEIRLPGELAGRESLVTIGAFDGIHLGHQHLIGQLVAQAQAQGRLAGLVTFYPHPATVLASQRVFPYLTTPGEKAVLLEQLGLDWITILNFDRQLAALPPSAFVRHLYQQLNMRGLYVSAGFALGHNRAGNVAALQALGQEMGFDVHIVSVLENDGVRISSSHIRALLRHGHVGTAAGLLGRYYALAGEVIHGAQRGRCIGFPTANLQVSPERIIPANGIYATYAILGTERHQAVTSIGTRPTFDNGKQSVEAYVMDFDQDIYGCDLVIEFVARLRSEIKFPSVQDLVDQINQDVCDAQAAFAQQA